MITFGPVPSRRLGRSLGINNIPPKICSYSCIYCQIGDTNSMSVSRSAFFTPEQIFKEVSYKIKAASEINESIDYLTFVPDGEPTLDINLGRSIKLLREFGIKIAVITNSSLIWDKNVRDDLCFADWVSVKVDTINEDIWHKIDRPAGKLNFGKIIDGLKSFATVFNGELVAETMLVDNINDSIENLQFTADFIKSLNVGKSYLMVPTRPPAVSSAVPPPEETINIAYQVYSEMLGNVEMIAFSEGTDFSYHSDAEKELLEILSVHPMHIDAMDEFLRKAGENESFLYKLITNGQIKKVEYNNHFFFLKVLQKHKNRKFFN